MIPLLAGLGPSLIAGGASLLGGIIANRSSARSAQRQMDFQEEMSNTSYQRQVADMKAAGINPMLSAKMGGASTPPGSASQFENVVAPAVSSGQAALQAQQAVAQVELLKAQAAKVRSETMTEEMTRNRYLTETERSASAVGLTRAQTRESGMRTDLVHEQWLTEPVRRFLLSMQGMHEGVRADVANSAFAEDVMRRKAEGMLAHLSIAERRAVSKFFESTVGEATPWLRNLLMILRASAGVR